MSCAMFIVSDCPLKEVSYPPDFAIYVDIDRKIVDDGGKDDGFAIIPTKRVLEIPSEKTYYAVLEWQYTPGRAKKIIEYLREQVKTAGEMELWHVWQDMGFDHQVRTAEILINELTIDDIQELYEIEVWREPVTDYCYVIKGNRGV